MTFQVLLSPQRQPTRTIKRYFRNMERMGVPRFIVDKVRSQATHRIGTPQGA